VNIRFTSSLTPEDENMIAPALLGALAGILNLLPIAYVVRIDTSDAQVYQQSGPRSPQPGPPEQTRSIPEEDRFHNMTANGPSSSRGTVSRGAATRPTG
jgi:hypothetical protein